MPFTLPVPFITLPNGVGTNIPHEAQSLLNSGAVLAFELEAKAHNHGTAAYAGVRIAVPDPSAEHALRWLWTHTEICDYEASIPGLTIAALALNQSYQRVLPPCDIYMAWKDHEPDTDDGVSYITISLFKDGLTIGESDPQNGLEYDFRDLYNALEEDDDTVLHTFPTGRILAIATPTPSTSAHAILAVHQRAARVLDQWTRVHPNYAAEFSDTLTPLPLCPPSVADITEALAATR